MSKSKIESNFEGKVALVTGSSQGLGLCIARTLHKQGCQIVLNGRDQTNLDNATTLLPGAIGIAADVCCVTEANRLVESALQSFGQLDIVVCNVGSGKSVPPGNETAEEWMRVFKVNFFSATNVVEAAIEPLKESKGNIVCISSICGMEVVPGAPITYSTAKAALNAWVHGISRPLGEYGVRINAIAPGNLLFEGSVWEQKLQDEADVVEGMVKTEVALGRLGTDKEVANHVAFLCSHAASFTTGAIFAVDGGQTRSR